MKIKDLGTAEAEEILALPRCIVSHFSHKGGLTHTQLKREAANMA